MLLITLMIMLGVVALGMIGLVIYEVVTTAKGHPSPRLNTIRPLIGPIALAVLAIIGVKVLYDRHKLASCKKTS